MPRKDCKAKFYYQGFSRPTTTPVPDDVFDVIAPELTEAELRVLLYIVRRTFGFKKDYDSISLTQMVRGIKTKAGKVLDRGTGMSRQGVMNGVNGLLEKGVIEVKTAIGSDGVRKVNVYSLRFKEGVVNEVDYPSQRSRLGVGNQVDLQQTVLQQTDYVVVIEKLKKFKIEEKKAEELAIKYPPEYIEQKIEFLEWKLDPETKTRGAPVQDPAGWLIRAIEKDWQPPSAFKTRAQRREEAEEKAREEAEREKQQKERREQEKRRHEEKLVQLQEKYGTTERELDLWAQALKEIELQTTKATYQAWLPQTQLLTIKDDVAVIGAPNRMAQEWLEYRLHKMIERTLEGLLNTSVKLKFVVLEKPL